MEIFVIIAGVLLLPFVLVVLNGAPYLPTHKKQIQKMFDELKFKKGSTVVDFGSGDGVFLLLAAERGYKAIGYEINPYLILVSLWRTRKYRKLVTVKWRSFWSVKLPRETDLVFVFLAQHFMKRLDKKLESEKQSRPLYLASVGFKVLSRKESSQSEAVYLYKY